MNVLKELELSEFNYGACSGQGKWSNTSDAGEIVSINPSNEENIASVYQCSEEDFDRNSSTFVKCDPNNDNIAVIYEKFAMDTTFATEFNLLCDDQYKVRCLILIYCLLNFI